MLSGFVCAFHLATQGFKSQAHHLHFYQFKFELWTVEKTKINRKRGLDWPIFKTNSMLFPGIEGLSSKLFLPSQNFPSGILTAAQPGKPRARTRTSTCTRWRSTATRFAWATTSSSSARLTSTTRSRRRRTTGSRAWKRWNGKRPVSHVGTWVLRHQCDQMVE